MLEQLLNIAEKKIQDDPLQAIRCGEFDVSDELAREVIKEAFDQYGYDAVAKMALEHYGKYLCCKSEHIAWQAYEDKVQGRTTFKDLIAGGLYDTFR